MKTQPKSVFPGLALILTALIALGLTVQPAAAEGAYQDSPCGITLSDAASDASIVADKATWSHDQNEPEWACEASFEWRENEWFWNVATFKIATWYDDPQIVPPYSCQGVSGCEETNFHEFPAKLEEGYQGSLSLLWYVEREGNHYILLVSKDTGGRNTEQAEVMELAEALWLAADGRLPAGDGSAGEDPVDQPGGDVPTPAGNQPGEDVPVTPGDQSGDPSKSLGPIATTPFVPLLGALFGTLIGWLVSVAVINWPVLKTSLTSLLQSGMASDPAAPLPKDWKEWEDRYVQHELPTYRGPGLEENTAVHISVEDAKIEVIQFYSDELPAESRTRVEKASMRKLEAAEFDAEYLKVYGPDQDYGFASAFVNANTGDMFVCTPREINYTPVHELMHVASNGTFKASTNQAMDEAVTEYFTHKITNERKIVRSSEYDELGSTDVVIEIVKLSGDQGEELLRKAYFRPGKDGVEELRKAVDQKLGPGAFDKAVELVGRPYAPSKQMALDLLRGRGIGRK